MSDKLNEIYNRWLEIPKLRLVLDFDNNSEDSLLASFGYDDDRYEDMPEAWLTAKANSGDTTLTSPEIAEVLAEAPNDIFILFTIIADLKLKLSKVLH